MTRAYAFPGLLVAAMLLVSSNHGQEQGRGRKYKPPPPTCNVTVTVVRSYNGKPVEDASVVFHPLKDGRDDGNMELKTNENGKVSIDIIPMGDTIRLQVIADGFQTFGREYSLPSDTKAIVVKLNRPGQPYSIYQKHPTDDNGQAVPEPQKPQ
ncbi:MAG: carboxypeptidase-like regulatory domain-containing protein [Acidobacteriaceae bacterium]